MSKNSMWCILLTCWVFIVLLAYWLFFLLRYVYLCFKLYVICLLTHNQHHYQRLSCKKKKKIPLFPFQPITFLHCRPNGCMSVPLSSIAAPPEDNAQATGGAAVTRSDSRWRAERHRHRMLKVHHLVCNHGPNFNLQRASVPVPPEGRDDVRSITEVLSFGVGRTRPQRTAWNTWNPTAPRERPKKYSRWRWFEVKVDHLGLGCEKKPRSYQGHLSANGRQKSIKYQFTHLPLDVQHIVLVYKTLCILIFG